jgi:hypothetical protein
MADLLIENVPDELCCAYRSMPNEKRRLVAFELTAVLRQISRKRPELEDDEQYSERFRELRANGMLKPITDELIEDAIAGRTV